MNVPPKRLRYRPYPYSLEADDDPDTFSCWPDLWAAMTREQGAVEIEIPEDMVLPVGVWNIPEACTVTFGRGSDLDAARRRSK